MGKVDEAKLQIKIETMLPLLNEYQRRMFLSAEAKSIGQGGISVVSRLSGVSRPTLTSQVKELDDAKRQVLAAGRSRTSGGGRKPLWEYQPKILDALKGLVDAHTKGGPMHLLLYIANPCENEPRSSSVLPALGQCAAKSRGHLNWICYTNKSQRNLSEALEKKGYKAGKNTVSRMLKMLGYSLQADKKTLTAKPSHPDRNEQFEHINDETKKAASKGNPVISIDLFQNHFESF